MLTKLVWNPPPHVILIYNLHWLSDYKCLNQLLDFFVDWTLPWLWVTWLHGRKLLVSLVTSQIAVWLRCLWDLVCSGHYFLKQEKFEMYKVHTKKDKWRRKKMGVCQTSLGISCKYITGSLLYIHTLMSALRNIKVGFEIWPHLHLVPIGVYFGIF